MIIHVLSKILPIRIVLLVVAALALSALAITLTRVPVPRNDYQLYASIARSRQLAGVGVPSTLWSAPSPVDHIPFYGPVFFDLEAGAFQLFGVSIASSRLVSLLGALLLCAGGALLAGRLSHSPDRWLCGFTLLLLTPEVGSAATRGDMESIAVGLEVMALATFVAGLASGRRADWLGALAGGLLTLAALTTPRTYPFVFAFVVSGLWLFLIRGRNPDARRQFLVSMTVLVAGMSGWAIWSQGNPIRWVRFIAYVFTHEDTDVALLPSALRWWQFSASVAVTPLFAAAGAVIAVASLGQGRQTSERATTAIMFALLVAGMAGVLTFAGMNLTFLWGGYFALPLLAVVLALPYRELRVPPFVVVTGLCLLLACDLGAAGLKYARVAATWNARDPRPLDHFVQEHVPPGAAVVGPDRLYFFAVEGSGAHYVGANLQSVADWTRWVPIIDPAAANRQWQFPPTPTPRFLIWAPEDDEFPDRYACALDHVIALYHPPPNQLERLGRFSGIRDVGYPVTTLYELPPGCPTRDE